LAILTLKNRYPAEAFDGRFDGQRYIVKDKLAVPDYVAHHLKKQSIVRDNPVTGENEYRLSIVEIDGDQPMLDSLPVETLDRTDMDFPKAKLIPGVKTPVPQQRESFGSLVLDQASKR